ncbi:MAG TPA: ABC transporter ATP-binding protein [Beutenbergiaceae bacterium]|nr:ABC transporter ATP-binding protein [Beutenbergiaceae bacterium]
MQYAVELAGVTKTFRTRHGQVRAVDDVSLKVARGTVVAFLGPNGAGKTTTLDMLLGLVNPTRGRVEVLGLQPREAVRAGKVSAVLQSGGLLRDLRVGETVELIAATFPNTIPAAEALERAGLTPLAKRRVSKCSGGEQQRLRFALALLPDPETLILDEPTTGMDVTARREFWDTMHAEAQRGRTIIFATHYLEEAESFAERITMISHGRIVADGPTQEIREHVAGRVVTATFTDPEQARSTLTAREDVTAVHGGNTRLQIHTSNSDQVATAVLTQLGGSDVEIAAGSLDEAFRTLT